MPEMRQNPVTKHWVIIATERAKRPEQPLLQPDDSDLPDHKQECFFCWGNEHTTPPEVYSYRLDNSEPDTPGWLLRVVANKFAALNFNGFFNVQTFNPLYSISYATGNAEVVIETNNHSRSTSKQSLSEIDIIIKSYIERYKAISSEPQIKYILIFKNHGSLAGASLEHPHSQIISIPVVPPAVFEEIEGANTHYQQYNSCIYCDVLKHELKFRERIIFENDLFVSLEPYASRTPFETVILPKFHSARFEELEACQIKSLSEVWKATFSKLDTGLDNPPYNCFIHTSPTQQNVANSFHWHVEIIPKLTIAAGFELGSGMFINITIPEDCADFLRQIDVY